MANPVMLQRGEFYGVLFGWVLAVIFGLLTMAYMKFTPAKVFLKAWFKKTPVAWVKHRTGLGEFMSGVVEDPGSMDVKDMGFVLLTEGSHVREKKSGAAVFDVFSEYGASISQEYAPIIQELKEAGFKITTYDDYSRLVKLAGDENEAAKYIFALPESEREEARKKVVQLKSLSIKILPYKAYKMHDLAAMFPNNISPVYVDAKVTNAVNRMVKKMQLSQKMWLYVGFGALLIVLAIILVMKTIKQPAPQVIIETLEAGVRVASVAGQNITM